MFLSPYYSGPVTFLYLSTGTEYLIPPSMALLSTGISSEVLGTQGLQTSDILTAFGEDTGLQEEAVKELLSSATVQDQVSYIPPYSPGSDTSSDSGVLSGVSEEDQFLAGLFGGDFSVLSSPVSGATPSAFDPSLLSLVYPSTASTELMPEPSATVTPSRQNERKSATPDPQLERNRKNAEAARQNRIKKKHYLESLEKERSSLKTENVVLKTKCHEYQQRCQRLQSEVEYLKSVIANESALSGLIENIPNVSSVKLTTSFSRKRSNPGESKVQAPAKRAKKTAYSGGVCLHVSKDVVSLEFCQNCSKQAAQS